MRHVASKRRQRLQSIHGRGPEADRARVPVVLADRGDLADLETKCRGLNQHLRVEDEVVAVLKKWNRLEKSARICAITSVVLGYMQPEHAVLGCRKEAIADALPPRHAGLRRVYAQPPGAEHDVSLAVLDDPTKIRNDRRVVLTVRVQHDHDVGSHLQGLAIAGLLIPAVPEIALMANHIQP